MSDAALMSLRADLIEHGVVFTLRSYYEQVSKFLEAQSLNVEIHDLRDYIRIDLCQVSAPVG